MPDVLIAGAGPAGWVLAAQCVRLGLHTTVVAPQPTRPWQATYGLWGDELAALPDGVAAARPTVVRAFTNKAHVLNRRYAILDNERLRAALATGVEVVAGRVVRATGTSADLADGRTLTARTVVDATGSRGGTAEQQAFGVIVPEAVAAPVVAPGEAIFMDFRSPGGTFLYAMPLGDGRVLLEETSLAGRPGPGFRALRTALADRLAGYGIALPGTAPVERVRFRLDPALPRRGPVVPFGAAAGLMHPASGYSVGEAVRLAPAVAAAIAARTDPWPLLWPVRARFVRLLRRRGLEMILSLSAAQTRDFFTHFFDLPDRLQRGYLSERADPALAMAAMREIFRHAPAPLRRACAAAVILPSRRPGPLVRI